MTAHPVDRGRGRRTVLGAEERSELARGGEAPHGPRTRGTACVRAPRGDLWDLRRGDADDDRSSPQARGWRSLAVATALEFNYLGAAIAFIWWILIPAVLVGLAVPLLMTPARWKLHAAGLLPLQPAVAVGLLLLLLGGVVWMARPVVAMSLDNFWHLHFTLVFPLFVVLKEVLGTGLERLPPDRLDGEQLHRRRRAGAVLAALLFAGAGALLASAFPFSTDAGLADLSGIRPRALVGAALGNAATVLGLSTVVASLYWLLREARAAAPVLDWAPTKLAAAPHTQRIAHLSDLHVVGERYGLRMEAGTRGPSGNGRLAEAFRRLNAMHAARPLDRVLITGDITDAGTRAEWVEFLAAVQRWPDLRDRLLFLPGNHDVNTVDRTNPGRLDLPWSVAGALRKLRIVLALDAVQGARVRLVDRRSGALGARLEEYLREGSRATLLRELAERGTWRGRWEVVKVWDAIFPLVAPPTGESSGVVLLDSNARRHFS